MSDDVVTCKACRSPLTPGARKCVACGTDQTWRGGITHLSVVVGTISAIASLAVLAATNVYEFVIPKQGQLKLALMSELQYDDQVLAFRCSGPQGERDGVYLFGAPSSEMVLPVIVTNVGRAPLQISSARMTFLSRPADPPGTTNEPLNPSYGFADASLIQPVELGPREGRVVPLRFRVGREWNGGFGWRDYPLVDKLTEGVARLPFGPQHIALSLTYTSVQGQTTLKRAADLQTYGSAGAKITLDGRPLDGPSICS